MVDYNSKYYEENDQSEDRPALRFYFRVFNNLMKTGNDHQKVLEFGSGVGHLTKRLEEKYNCYALDISNYALEQVKKNAPKAKTVKSLDQIRNEDLDGVIALHVLEHVKDPKETIYQLASKLKNGGKILFVVPNPNGLGHKIKGDKWFAYSDKTHISLLNEGEWLLAVQEAGLIIERASADGMWDIPYLPIIPNFLQKLMFYPLAALQFVIGKTFLPRRWGECLIVEATKK